MKEEVKNFIINEIDKMFDVFPYISFKYGYDKDSEQHIIELDPDTEFRNEKYMELEFDFIDTFIKLFPEEDILFVSNNKYISVCDPIFIKKGSITVDGGLVSQPEVVSSNELINSPFKNFDNIYIEKQNLVLAEALAENLNNILISNLAIQTENSAFAMAA